jgi:4-hydroxybenzoate polyprenyltransferase
MNEYIEMLRIKDWVKFYPIIPIIGAVLAYADLITLILIGIVFFCVIGYGFVINNYFDVEIDKKHTKKMEANKNPLAAGTVARSSILILCGVLLAIAVVISSLLNPVGLLFTLMSILFLTLYSAKYIRFKERFFVDIISHGMMSGLFPFLAGFTLAGGNLMLFSSTGLVVPLLFMVIGCEALITHQINDYREDLGNSDTTVVRIGLKNGWILLILFVVLSLINLEIIFYYFDIGAAISPELITDLFNVGIVIYICAFTYLVAYPIYMCRGEIKKCFQ